MTILFFVLYALFTLLIVGCVVAFFAVSPWFGFGVLVFGALAILVEFLERKYKKAAGIPTLFERAMKLKNEESSSSVTLEN